MAVHPKPTPTPTHLATGAPSPTPATEATTSAASAFTFDPMGFIAAYPLTVPIVLIALWIAASFGWKRLTLMYNVKGQPLAPLSQSLKSAFKIMLKEDTFPVIIKNQTLAAKVPWLTWKRYWQITLAAFIVIVAVGGRLPLGIGNYFLAVDLLLLLAGIGHLRKIFQYRHRILMQMFEVANGEMRYPRGAELNPWGYIQVSDWHDLYSPATTAVMYPAKYRSEDARNRQAFEINFNGTVSDQHAWSYTWESSNNRVIAEPVPFISEKANYPFPDRSPWDVFPLGIAAAGAQAAWTPSIMPHMLIAGTTGSGKLIEGSTRIPTSAGWTTMGALKVGDQLFDEKGNVTRVTWVSDVNPTPNLFDVEFSDGSIITADGDHLWWTETRQARESSWNATRKAVSRRPLISAENREALRVLSASVTPADEITLSEIAAVAGIAPETSWFRDIAANLGPVGELQVNVATHYRDQTVEQMQQVRLFNAHRAWSTLGSYEPKGPAWHRLSETFLTLAKASTDRDEVTTGEIAALLGMPKKRAAGTMHKLGVTPLRREGGGQSAVSFYPAALAWQALYNASMFRVPAWFGKREECLQLAAAADTSAEISGREVAAVLGISTVAEAGTVLERLGVPARKARTLVTLNVPEKTIVREGRWASTYLTQALCAALIEQGERPANDQRHRKTHGSVKTTTQILATLRTPSGHANHAIPVSAALDLPEAALPVSPYAFGAWLGDGYSRSGQICGIDVEIVRHIEAEGFPLTSTSRDMRKHEDYRIWKFNQLHDALKSSGLLQRTTAEGTRKAIPAIYLRSSIAQRRALLAGLLDTDGTVAPQGTVQFTNTNRRIADGALELALSLGYRATMREGRAILDGVDCGPKWTVSFTCTESPFRLTRKTTAFLERQGNRNELKTNSRYIVDVRPVASRPGLCIQVDSPSRLFLAGESFIPTHNSVTQRTILLHALQSPDWRIVLIDPKMVELSEYRNSPNVLRVATSLADSVQVIEQVEQEMMSRYTRMKDVGGVNHFRSLPEPPPAVLLMVDETFALLSPSGIKSDEGKEQDEMKARIGILIGSIARLGRAAGIHMVLATQRPDAKVLPGEVKANLDARIAQGRMDSIPSLMTLDSDAATRLPPIKGRAILRTGNDFTEFQAYFLPPEHLPQVLEMSAAIAQGDTSFLDEPEPEPEPVKEPAFKMPKVSFKPGGKISEWIAKRQAIVAENEQRAGRTPEARAARDASRAAAPASAPAEPAAPVMSAARADVSIAEIAAQANGRALTLDFDGEDLFTGSPARQAPLMSTPAPEAATTPVDADVEDEFAFDPDAEADDAAAMAAFAAGPATPAAPIDFDDDDPFDDGFYDDQDDSPAAYGEIDDAYGYVDDLDDVDDVDEQVMVGSSAPGAPVAPAMPAASVTVQEVMRRAAERGVPIPASELLAALRAEAYRQQAAAAAPAPLPVPEPVTVAEPVAPAPVAPARRVVPLPPENVIPAPPARRPARADFPTPTAAPAAPAPAAPAPVAQPPVAQPSPAPVAPATVVFTAPEEAWGERADESPIEAPWMPPMPPAPVNPNRSPFAARPAVPATPTPVAPAPAPATPPAPPAGNGPTRPGSGTPAP